MSKVLLFTGLLVAGIFLRAVFTGRAQLAVADFQDLPAGERVARARESKGEVVRERCQTAGLEYPPAELFLRAFKREKELEVWGRGEGGTWKKVAMYPVVADSGGPGPKRREGDLQVPEGFYMIDLWNPQSNYRLSMRVNYPNASDLKRSDPRKPGSDIYIHGRDRSVGCLAMGDEAIDELYILTADVKDGGQTQIPIHFFPARMVGEAWTKQQAAHPQHAAFWAELQPGYDVFEKKRAVPRVAVTADGSYRVSED